MNMYYFVGWALARAARKEMGDSVAAHVLLVMAIGANMDGAYTSSLTSLADSCRLDTERVLDALHDLSEAGLISIGDYKDPEGNSGIKLLIPRCKNGTYAGTPWQPKCPEDEDGTDGR